MQAGWGVHACHLVRKQRGEQLLHVAELLVDLDLRHDLVDLLVDLRHDAVERRFLADVLEQHRHVRPQRSHLVLEDGEALAGHAPAWRNGAGR